MAHMLDLLDYSNEVSKGLTKDSTNNIHLVVSPEFLRVAGIYIYEAPIYFLPCQVLGHNYWAVPTHKTKGCHSSCHRIVTYRQL